MLCSVSGLGHGSGLAILWLGLEVGTAPQERQNPFSKVTHTELGMRLQGGWAGVSVKRSCVLELLSWLHRVLALRTSLWPPRQPMPQG